MARFYSWKDTDIESLPASVFQDYWLAITPIEAQEALLGIQVATYPDMRKEDRRKTYRSLQRLSKKFVERDKKGLKDFREYAAMLKENKPNG